MADIFTPKKRSEVMSAIRGRDTRPEREVRSIVHRLGYRFRLNVRGLPGSPDLVLPRLRTVIFVHGCFWHRHVDCRYATTPSTRRRFWQEKFDANVARDQRVARRLRRLGWSVLTVWECQLRRPEALRTRLSRSLARREDLGPRAEVKAERKADRVRLRDQAGIGSVGSSQGQPSSTSLE